VLRKKLLSIHAIYSYIAGLWAEELHTELLWRVEEGTTVEPSEYVAPSWSWAGHDMSSGNTKLETSTEENPFEDQAAKYS